MAARKNNPAQESSASTTSAPGAPEREFVLTRIINAPRELVWKAWTEQKHIEQWWGDGVPANPRAWLVSAGRFKAIDGIRRRARFDALDDFAEQVEYIAGETTASYCEDIEDDRLRLMFTCCHPALPPDAQESYQRALALTRQEPERRFLERRLAELKN